MFIITLKDIFGLIFLGIGILTFIVIIVCIFIKNKFKEKR